MWKKTSEVGENCQRNYFVDEIIYTFRRGDDLKVFPIDRFVAGLLRVHLHCFFNEKNKEYNVLTKSPQKSYIFPSTIESKCNVRSFK